MGPFARRVEDEDEDLSAPPQEGDEARFTAARRKLYGGLRASVDELLTEVDEENAGARMAAVGRLCAGAAKLLMSLGSGAGTKPRDLLGDRETAGVHSMRELISAQAEANRPPTEVRLRHLTEAHLNAVNGQLDTTAAALRVEIDALVKQLGAPVPDHGATIGSIVGRMADASESAAESK